MRGVVTVVHKISDNVLGLLEPGAPPTNINFPQMTLMLQKQNISSMSDSTHSAQQGSLTLGDVSILLNTTRAEGNCYARQVISTKVVSFLMC